MGRVRVCSSLGLAVAVVAGTAPMAVAAPQQQGASGGLEEVVVTARKRQENLQDMAQSVSALDQKSIERNFAFNITQLSNVSPNLIIDDTNQGPGGVASIYIRGIGVAEVEKSFEPAVGVVIDGVYIGTMSGALAKSLDVQSIEVLRGPQGTLFGKNAIGGIIKIDRTKPTGEFGGKVRLGYDNYETWTTDAVLNFGLTDNIAVKLTGARHNQQKGYYNNLTTGRNDGKNDYKSWGWDVLYTPTENLSLRYIFQRERTDQDTPPLLNLAQPDQLFCVAYNQCAKSLHDPQGGSRYKVLQQGHNTANFNADTHTIQAHWDLGSKYAIDYVFGYRDTDENAYQDWDATPLLLYETTRPSKYKQVSNELRLTKTSSDMWNYTVGIYRWNSRYNIHLNSFIGFAVPNTIIDVPQFVTETDKSWAGFFEGDLKFSEKWTLTLGGRYTREEKSQGVNDPSIQNLNNPTDHSWDRFTPKVALKYYFNDSAMMYTLFSTGFRSGGYNGRATTPIGLTAHYNPESVKNLEIGGKTEWFDHRLRLNADGFYTLYDDKQEEVHLPTTIGTGQETVIKNAATAILYGVEVELLAMPIDGLTIRGNVGYLHAEYDKFKGDVNGDGIVTDNTHLKLRHAPTYTGSLSATYDWNLGPGEAWVRGAWQYIGAEEVTFLNDPQAHNKRQNLVSASINYKYKNAQFSIYGHNLLKDDAYQIGYNVAGLWTYAAPRAPRTYGVQLTYSF